MDSKKLGVLAVCLILWYGAGILGSFAFSGDSNVDWYLSVKPSLAPPSWVFAVVWNVLYFLIALSLFFVWNKKKRRKEIIGWYGSNLIFNFLWSIIYFGYHRTGLALFDLFLVWATIIGMMLVSYKLDRRAFYLLIPYLLWVSFAAILNFQSFLS